MLDQPSWIPPWLKEGVAPLLAVIIIIGGFATLWIHPELKTETIAVMMAVVMFYFGSSKSSQAKDDTISTQLAAKDDTIKEQLDKKS